MAREYNWNVKNKATKGYEVRWKGWQYNAQLFNNNLMASFQNTATAVKVCLASRNGSHFVACSVTVAL